jgi:hypothetical protein
MLPRDELLQRMRDLRAALEGVCGLLVSPSPEVLDRCTPMLEVAASTLRGCQKDLHFASADPAFRVEARHLVWAVRLAGRLLECGWEYHQGWAQRLGAMAAGYEPGGGPATLKMCSRLSLSA